METILAAEAFQRLSCEVLVIGSGTSGLSTALELARRGVGDVVLADHGPFGGFAHRSRAAAEPALPVPPATWGSESRDYAVPPGLASCVGGRSRCWFGVVVGVQPHILAERWPARVATELLGDGPGSYASVLRDLDEWRGEPVAAAQCGSDETVRGALDRLCPGTGFTVVPQAAYSRVTGRGREWWVYSPLLAWSGEGLSRHRDAPLPTIVHGLAALRVVRDGDRVAGALFRSADGGLREIGARTVVLAAGTLENTRLYAQVLGDSGAAPRAWAGLNDHLAHGMVAPLPDSLRGAWRYPDRPLLWSEHEREHHANLFVYVHCVGVPEPLLEICWLAQQEEPFGDTVHFGESGQVWSATVSAGLSSVDIEAMSARDEYATELLRSMSVSVANGPVSDGRPALELPDAIASAVAGRNAVRFSNPLGTANHEAGTVPLGEQLDYGGRAPGYPNLFLAGPATFPPAGAANPSLTMMALAAQTAAAIAGG